MKLFRFFSRSLHPVSTRAVLIKKSKPLAASETGFVMWPLWVEVLEARIAPATFVWDGSAGDSNWFTAANWTPDGVPGAADTATLSVNSTITLNAAASVGAFTQSSGTFTGSGAFTILGDLTWTGGTMEGTGATNVDGPGSTISGANVGKGLNRTLNNTGTITVNSPDINSDMYFAWRAEQQRHRQRDFRRRVPGTLP